MLTYTKMLTHTKINTNLDQAKDGRWVLLIGGTMENCFDDWQSPPVVIAQWQQSETTPRGEWMFASYDAGYYGAWAHPVGFVELSDLGLVRTKEQKM